MPAFTTISGLSNGKCIITVATTVNQSKQIAVNEIHLLARTGPSVYIQPNHTFKMVGRPQIDMTMDVFNTFQTQKGNHWFSR